MTEALKIEVGRSYRDASGRKVTIDRESSGVFWAADKRAYGYLPDGTAWAGTSVNLVDEWGYGSENTKVSRNLYADSAYATLSLAPNTTFMESTSKAWARLSTDGELQEFDEAECRASAQRKEIYAVLCTALLDADRAKFRADLQSCAPSEVPYSSAKHEWARLGKKELFAQILKAIDHLAADGDERCTREHAEGECGMTDEQLKRGRQIQGLLADLAHEREAWQESPLQFGLCGRGVEIVPPEALAQFKGACLREIDRREAALRAEWVAL